MRSNPALAGRSCCQVTYFFGFCFDSLRSIALLHPPRAGCRCGCLLRPALRCRGHSAWLGRCAGSLWSYRPRLRRPRVVLIPLPAAGLPLGGLSSEPLEPIPTSQSTWLAQWALDFCYAAPAEGFLRPQPDGADFARVSRYWRQTPRVWRCSTARWPACCCASGSQSPCTVAAGQPGVQRVPRAAGQARTARSARH